MGRFAGADTLIYVDLPLFMHFLWVTKRLAKGLFVNPEGWPEGSPILSSTINSYRVLWLCHRRLTPKYRELVSAARQHKRVHHLRSAAEMDVFLYGFTQKLHVSELGQKRHKLFSFDGISAQVQAGS